MYLSTETVLIVLAAVFMASLGDLLGPILGWLLKAALVVIAVLAAVFSVWYLAITYPIAEKILGFAGIFLFSAVWLAFFANCLYEDREDLKRFWLWITGQAGPEHQQPRLSQQARVE